MGMYQKRKVRQEKSANNVEENNGKMNINWVMVIYENSLKSIEITSFL